MKERRRDLVFPWSFSLLVICRIRRRLICDPYLMKDKSNGL